MEETFDFDFIKSKIRTKKVERIKKSKEKVLEREWKTVFHF